MERASLNRQQGYLGCAAKRVLGGTSTAAALRRFLANPDFSVPLTTTVVPSRGTGSATFTRATTATVTDFEGLVRNVLSGEVRFQGARRVKNGVRNSDTLFSANWTKNLGTHTATVAANGDVTWLSGDFIAETAGTLAGAAGQTCVLSFTAAALGGTTKVTARIDRNGAAQSNQINISISATPARYSMRATLDNGTAIPVPRFDYFDGNVNITNVMIEDVTGQANQNPSEYVSVGVLSSPFHGAMVDGVKYFDYQNGNTVASNVVTEASGAAIAISTLLGWLEEQQSTNLCLQSADLSNASWTKTNTTIGGSVTLPDGTTGTVNKVQETATTAFHTVSQTFTKAASALVYTLTVYVKQAERTWCGISIDDGPNSSAWYFNLATGVLGSQQNAGTPFTSVSASIVAAANGFYRVSLTLTSNTATTIHANIFPATGDLTGSYAGSAGSGIYAVGAQLEQLGFATSYIPTAGATVTRNADVLTYPSTNNLLGTMGMFAAEVAVAPASGSSSYIASTDANGLPLFIDGTNSQARFFDGANNNSGAAFTKSTTTASKVATSWGGTTGQTCVNRTTATATAFDGDLGAGTVITLGSNNGANNFANGCIKNVRIWKTAGSSAAMAAATA